MPSAAFSLSASQRAALAQREHAGTLWPRGVEGVGVDADEQVGLHAPRFLYAGVQGHKIVAFAGHDSTHVGARIDALAQQQRHLQHHVLLARAAGPDRTRVLAAVARIEHDDEGPLGAAGLVGRPRLGWLLRLALLSPRQEVAQRIGWGLLRAEGGPIAPLQVGNQGLQRIDRLLGIQIDDQPVLVMRHRPDLKDLGAHGMAQADDQLHGASLRLGEVDAGNVGVVLGHLAGPVAQRLLPRQTFDV
jgi:hypothetical protein